MPGPKMGPRPADFDEQLIRQAPTYIKWAALNDGEKLRYACREFIKGQGDDEERLMRRIMIARRNNVKDHITLKRARQLTTTSTSASASETIGTDKGPPNKTAKIESGAGTMESIGTTASGSTRKRRSGTLFSDSEVAKEMDEVAVESTRSFRKWKTLEEGEVFVYNQKYVKGKENHEWLLKKNIWRRMRYRRENKKIVEKLREVDVPMNIHKQENSGDVKQMSESHDSGGQIHEQVENSEHGASDPSESTGMVQADDEAVQAAVKVAESYTQSAHYTNTSGVVHNPLDAVADSAALDAAARLAAVTTAAAAQPTTSVDV